MEMRINKFHLLGLFMSFWLISCFPVQADEIKYFEKKKCFYNTPNNNCLFGNELQKNDLERHDGYYEVYYKDDKVVSAIGYRKSIMEGHHIFFLLPDDDRRISGELEFDRLGRVTKYIKNPYGDIYSYEFCKYNYSNQTTKTKCFNKRGIVK